ncbi:hypothetical protein PAMA_001155 [Pampus argenteus]
MLGKGAGLLGANERYLQPPVKLPSGDDTHAGHHAEAVIRLGFTLCGQLHSAAPWPSEPPTGKTVKSYHGERKRKKKRPGQKASKLLQAKSREMLPKHCKLIMALNIYYMTAGGLYGGDVRERSELGRGIRRTGERERGIDFEVISIVTSFNPGRGTFQRDKGIVSGRKPLLSSHNALHKGAATGL